MPNMNNVLAVIMAGGRGTRLHPLTQACAKPAVTIAGRYRLVDVPISNCINSGISQIAVLTQANPASLHEHISYAYNFNTPDKWVRIFAGAETSDGTSWYRGTADAVRKQLSEIQKTGAEYTLILAGDHLYCMDYGEMMRFHMQKKADITVAVQPVALNEASRFGILKRAANGRILSFVEKPTHFELQDQFVSCGDPDKPFLGSMGIYLFNTRLLTNWLINHLDQDDFGSDIIPRAIHAYGVYGYVFDGYWQDIGTVRSFYEANLALTKPGAPFHFAYPRSPMVTATLTLPPPHIVNSQLKEVLIGRGSTITNARLEHSVIGVRSQISNDTVIKDTVMMGADNYLSDGVDANCYIEGAILDKNARIGKNVTIRPFPRGIEMDCHNWFVRDGIVVIPRDAEIAAGSVISPEAFSFKELATQSDQDFGYKIGPDGKVGHSVKDLPIRDVLEAVH